MVVTRGGARQAVNGLYCAGVCGVCSCVVVCWLRVVVTKPRVKAPNRD